MLPLLLNQSCCFMYNFALILAASCCNNKCMCCFRNTRKRLVQKTSSEHLSIEATYKITPNYKCSSTTNFLPNLIKKILRYKLFFHENEKHILKLNTITINLFQFQIFNKCFIYGYAILIYTNIKYYLFV